MKIYVIGIDFDLKNYSILHKKIIPYLENNYSATIEYVDWLTKKDINISNYEDGDAYIYVGIDNVFNSFSQNEIIIVPSDTKNEIANKFSSFIEKFFTKKELSQENIKSEENSNSSNNINESQECKCNYNIIKYDGEKSSLVGVKIIINDEEHFVSKEDFIELYKLEEMLTKNGIKISDIVVENVN